MKCPICGNTLRISKKDPRFALCDECRKKFRIPQAAKASSQTPVPPVHKEKTDTASASLNNTIEEMPGATQVFSRREVREALKAQNEAKKMAGRNTATAEESSNEQGEFHLRYANIPPKEVREKQEREMRKAYDELLSIGKEEREQKKKRGFFGRRKG